MFAAGELAMTASDLARWDISLIDQSVLTAASYKQLQTEVLLANGAPTGYGLGVSVGSSAVAVASRTPERSPALPPATKCFPTSVRPSSRW